jgi:hypothetical protein
MLKRAGIKGSETDLFHLLCIQYDQVVDRKQTEDDSEFWKMNSIQATTQKQGICYSQFWFKYDG